jgi:hypothetical protein
MKRYFFIIGFIIIAIMAFFTGRITHLCPDYERIAQEVELVRLVAPDGEDIDWEYPTPKQITLSQVLKKRGITPETVTYIKFVGDEASSTSGREAISRDKEEIQWLWNWIFDHAEPYSFWVPSGYRKVQIFTNENGPPAAYLYVNETDATSIDGVTGRFMCHGLENYIFNRLSTKKKG